MACSGYRQSGACSRYGRVSFRWWRRTPHSLRRARAQFLDELVHDLRVAPVEGMVSEFCNQASLEEFGGRFLTPCGAR